MGNYYYTIALKIFSITIRCFLIEFIAIKINLVGIFNVEVRHRHKMTGPQDTY